MPSTLHIIRQVGRRRRRLAGSATAVAIGAVLLQTACDTTPPLVQHGTMRQVMRDGHTEARVELSPLARPGTFAVGAATGLDGEVTIDDGDIWITRYADERISTTGPDIASTDAATLLTIARPISWSGTWRLGAAKGREFEAAIRDAARSDGLRAGDPFLFTIDGHADGMAVHIVAGRCPHAHPEAEAARLTLPAGAPVRIVGIFAEDRAGELTHHGSAIHAHAIFDRDGQATTAHIDAPAIESGARLRIGRLVPGPAPTPSR
jgi:alpha-acetolactate decarboxylase